MAAHTSRIVPAFDFSGALQLPATERFDRCLARARLLAASYQAICDYPCVPERGATESELAMMESRLGRPLPPEYRAFLSRCRYLKGRVHVTHELAPSAHPLCLSRAFSFGSLALDHEQNFWRLKTCVGI